MTAPDLDNLIRLLDERDADATPADAPTFWGTGRGVLTTDEVRAALLGRDVAQGLAS